MEPIFIGMGLNEGMHAASLHSEGPAHACLGFGGWFRSTYFMGLNGNPWQSLHITRLSLCSA